MASHNDEISWEFRAQNGLTCARVDHAVTKRRGVWHLLGGRRCSANPAQPEEFLTDLYVLDSESGEWQLLEQTSPLPRGVAGHSLVAARGRLHLFGGRTALGLSAELWSFDFTARVWGRRHHPQGSDMPAPREHHSAVVTPQGQMLVFGGCPEEEPAGVVWQLDMITKHWTRLVPPSGPQQRRRHAAALHRNKLYVAGGIAIPNGGVLQDCWAFDVETCAWEHIPVPEETINMRAGGASLLVGDIWVIHGGRQQETPGGTLEPAVGAVVLDLSSREWVSVAETSAQEDGGLAATTTRWGHQLCLMSDNCSVAVSGGVLCAAAAPPVALF